MIRHETIVMCDYCGEQMIFSDTTDEKASEEAERQGWLIDPDTDDVCPDCFADIEEDLLREEGKPPPRADGRPHLSECLQAAHPVEAWTDERYFCTCDDVSPDL